MSPLSLKGAKAAVKRGRVRAVEHAIHADTGEVTVRRDKERVVVKWVCGDQRSFTTDRLDYLLVALDLLATHEVWMGADDSDGQTFAVRLEGSDLRVHPNGNVSNGDDDIETLPWAEFHNALQDALAAVKE